MSLTFAKCQIMQLSDISSCYRQNLKLKQWAHKIFKQNCDKIAILPENIGAETWILDSLVYWSEVCDWHLFLLRNESEALFLLNLWEDIVKNNGNVGPRLLFFPANYTHSFKEKMLKPEAGFFRNQTLEALIGSEAMKTVIVSYPEAIMDPVPQLSNFLQAQFKLSLGGNFTYQQILDYLHAWNFKQEDFVSELGTFAIRGGIMDIYPYNTEWPIRLEWDGDTLIRLRYFDIRTQLSKENLSSILIIGKSEGIGKTTSLLNWCRAKEMKLWIRDQVECEAELEQEPTVWADYQSINNKVIWGNASKNLDDGQNLSWSLEPLPGFERNLSNLLKHIQALAKQNYKIHICAKDQDKAQRLCDLLKREEPQLQIYPQALRLPEGFIDHNLQFAFYTEHGFFKRNYNYTRKELITSKNWIALQRFDQLQVGDYVTHFDYGLALFSGLQRVENEHGIEERIRLTYKNNDVLWVGIHSLHKLSKWIPKEDNAIPELSALGSNNWARQKQRAKAKIKSLAFDLLKVYAQRSQKKGYAFSVDNLEQARFEAAFPYEDTVDQARATQEAKQDMESSSPMDRLICGDVGFGKTEIAMRLAFKAVQDLKQVALLVPTTVLAFQHYQSFQKRMQGTGINIDYLSRLKSTKARNLTLKNLAEHKVDIIIGTQALLGKEVKFKDLGLLIVDEEQKFGVATKERLRMIKENIDCLTLSATPIPRTLQFSLMGIRDISLMKTPPIDRLPVFTTVQQFDADYIKNAINTELARGGQVFFIHNRVQDLEIMARMISQLVPNASLTYAHGQMEVGQLESRLIAFVNHEYDILVSTNIIENGIDIPNVNTILVNRAENFGLSDLHQLRGRVGRGGRQAYCHLLVPSLANLSAVARQKLSTICSLSEFGSGFQIALKDLDLRGVGNILGAEQSGFLHEIGIEVYQSLLEETLRELNINTSNDTTIYIKDPAVELDLPLHISDQYISSDMERLFWYNRISRISKVEEEAEIVSVLADRFGPVPKELYDLFSLRRIRVMASECGIEKIILKNKLLRLLFVSKQTFPNFYDSDIFEQVLNYAKQLAELQQVILREQQDRLLFSVQNIGSITEIEDIIKPISSRF